MLHHSLFRTYVDVKYEHEAGVVQLGGGAQAELLCLTVGMGQHIMTCNYIIFGVGE